MALLCIKQLFEYSDHIADSIVTCSMLSHIAKYISLNQSAWCRFHANYNSFIHFACVNDSIYSFFFFLLTYHIIKLIESCSLSLYWQLLSILICIFCCVSKHGVSFSLHNASSFDIFHRFWIWHELFLTKARTVNLLTGSTIYEQMIR